MASSKWRGGEAARTAPAMGPPAPSRHRGVTGRAGSGGVGLLDPAVIAENLALVRERVGVDVDSGRHQIRRAPTTCRRCTRAGCGWWARTAATRWPRSRRCTATLFTWDFIGHVQSRKVREIAGRVTAGRTRIDSMSACRRIQDEDADVACLLQVNVAGEESKAGVELDAVDAFLADVEELGARAFPRPDDDAAAGGRPGSGAAVVRSAARAARPARAPLARKARVPGAVDGHQPGLRGGRRRGRHHRAGGERPCISGKVVGA